MSEKPLTSRGEKICIIDQDTLETYGATWSVVLHVPGKKRSASFVCHSSSLSLNLSPYFLIHSSFFFFRFVPFFFLSVLHRITYSLARLFTLPPDLRIFIRSRTLGNSLVIRPITVSDTRLFPFSTQFVADPTC